MGEPLLLTLAAVAVAVWLRRRPRDRWLDDRPPATGEWVRDLQPSQPLELMPRTPHTRDRRRA